MEGMPSAETKEPEPPLLKRTEDRRVWSSHSLVRSKPYLDLTRAVGGKLKSHMPSSAAAATAKERTKQTMVIQRLVMSGALPRFGGRACWMHAETRIARRKARRHRSGRAR